MTVTELQGVEGNRTTDNQLGYCHGNSTRCGAMTDEYEAGSPKVDQFVDKAERRQEFINRLRLIREEDRQKLQRIYLVSRGFSIFSLFAICLFVIYQLSPLLQKESEVNEAALTEEFAQFRASIIGSSAKEPVQPFFTIRTSFLTEISLALTYFQSEEDTISGVIVDEQQSSLSIRYDNLILYVGTFAILILSVFIVSNSVSRVRPKFQESYEPEYTHYEDDTTTGPQERNIGESARSEALPTVAILGQETERAKARADELYLRSTFMLAGGVVMAFVGIGIFYVSLPPVGSGESFSTDQYLVGAIRPVGILVFIEAVAWFLLRQYRAIIEDYKAFHRMYLKRANYLVSFKILSSYEDKGSELPLVVSLLQEDLSGILHSGDTTEGLEVQRAPENNPVFALLNTLAKSVQRRKVDEAQKDGGQDN